MPKVEEKEVDILDEKESLKSIMIKGRLTNQLQYLKNVHRIIWRHHYAWPFHKPVDPVALNIPVSQILYYTSAIYVGESPLLATNMW